MGNVLDVIGPTPQQIKTWHAENGCCKHHYAGMGDERACCVCDATDPCEQALDAVREALLDDDEPEDDEPDRDEDCTWCNRPARYCICDDAYEAMRDRELGL